MEQAIFFEALQKGLSYFSKGAFAHEFTVAKSDFFDNSGVLDEQSPTYTVRIQQFLDWFFFSRQLSDFRLAPSHCVFMLPDLRWSETEVEIVSSFKDVRHSLFDIIKVKEGVITIEDLLVKQKVDIQLGIQAKLFSKGQLFEGRLLNKDKESLLLKGRCFHPEEARPFLVEQIKRYRKDPDLDREQLFLATLKMRYLSERYPKASVDQIYNWQNRWIENEFSGS